MMQAEQNRLARLELFRHRNNAPQKRPASLTAGPRKTTKLAASCAKGGAVTTVERMQLGLSALVLKCGTTTCISITDMYDKYNKW